MKDSIESSADSSSSDSNGDVTTHLDTLEAEIEDLHDTVDALERIVTIKHDRALAYLEEICIGEDGHLVDDQESLLDEQGPVLDQLQTVVHEDHLRTEQQTRSQADARLDRKIATLAEATDVTLTDTQVAGEDKLARLLEYGPEDVIDHAYPVHYRARAVLAHATEWGTRTTDTFGARVVLDAATVKERLSLKRDESLTSTEVRRVFEKLEAFAADSPRRVLARTGGSDTNTLVIYLRPTEVNTDSSS